MIEARTITAYVLGYRHGSDGDQQTRRRDTPRFSREAYLAGYIRGLTDRMAGVVPQAEAPHWMNEAQAEALNDMYRRSPDGSPSRWHFFRRARKCSFGAGVAPVVGIHWRRMEIHVETDGFTHSVP